ncbi:MAG: hypothetical protein M1453_00715 [Acidobacteria bacterium]|nr:hypothetical protein [Acidobacteriota bacterium]
MRNLKGYCKSVFLVGTFFLVWVVTSAQVPESSISLIPNGSFRAEDGVFFAEAQRIHIYSHLPTSLNEKGERMTVPLDDGLRSKWKGEPYYHSSYVLKNGNWTIEGREFSDAPEQYLDFGPCDPQNQLSILPSQAELGRILGPSVKIKAEIQSGDKLGYSLVVYSDTPLSTINYSMKIGLLTHFAGSRKIVQTVNVGEFGHFCGTRTIRTRLSNGEHALVLLVYLDEPAASSDYIAVCSFLIKRNEPR